MPKDKNAKGRMPVTIRISQEVHDYIIGKAKPFETRDSILRRLLGIKPKK